MVRPVVNKLLAVIAALSAIAVGVTGYLVYMHIQPSDSAFCDISDTVSCSIVTKSQWAYLPVLEIPVAYAGFATYVLFLVVTLMLLKKFNWRKIHSKLTELMVLNFLRYFSVFGFLFSLYLTYIEAFKLQTWCPLCVTQQIIILIMMILFFRINSVINEDKKTSKVCEFC